MEIRLHSFISLSEVNGPGKRSVLWVQGCTLGCIECVNKKTWDLRGGYNIEVSKLFSQLPLDKIEGVTISGGEPFLQSRGCMEFALLCKKAGLSVLVYSGFYLEELKEKNDKDIENFLENIDILIDGPYKKDIKQNHPRAGSGNQRVIYLSPEYISSEPEICKDCREREFHIYDNGYLVETGI